MVQFMKYLSELFLNDGAGQGGLTSALVFLPDIGNFLFYI